MDAEFETFDVLSDPLVREEIKKFSNWPTIPQCYIAGEFVGGSDILLELFESGAFTRVVVVVDFHGDVARVKSHRWAGSQFCARIADTTTGELETMLEGATKA